MTLASGAGQRGRTHECDCEGWGSPRHGCYSLLMITVCTASATPPEPCRRLPRHATATRFAEAVSRARLSLSYPRIPPNNN